MTIRLLWLDYENPGTEVVEIGVTVLTIIHGNQLLKDFASRLHNFHPWVYGSNYCLAKSDSSCKETGCQTVFPHWQG